MAFKNYDANFSAVLPRMRSVAEISAEVELWRSGRATDVTRSQVASVELQIRNADDLYRRRQYEPALQQFRQARASIYALLYPGLMSVLTLLPKICYCPYLRRWKPVCSIFRCTLPIRCGR
jgi:hypothetical protein